MSDPVFRHLGIFELGLEDVDVFATPEEGGSFSVLTTKRQRPGLWIGIKAERFFEAMGVLLHEGQEFLMVRDGNRFEASPNTSPNHEHYRFMFCHQEFGSMCYRLAHFVEKVRPVLEKAHRDFHRAAKLKAKPKKRPAKRQKKK